MFLCNRNPIINSMKNVDIENMMNSMNSVNFDRRRFLKTMAATGMLTLLPSNNAKAFSSNAKGKIVVVGGGAAGISMAARLQRWLDEPDITLIDPSDRQYYQPGYTLIASGVYTADEVWKEQKNCIPKGVKWIKDSVNAIDPVMNQVTTNENGVLSYDFLVLTPGIQTDWAKVEGITQATLGAGNAHSIYDFEGAQKTWIAMQDFVDNGGRGIFTDTYTKHKCGGAPKKICLLTEHQARKRNKRENVQLDFYTAAKQLYDVPLYTPRLLEIYEERNVPINLFTRVKGIDTDTKTVYFERIETVGEEKLSTSFSENYDFLHFTPPMTAPDFTREAGLCNTDDMSAPEAWISVDKYTMVHTTYPNIVSLGDCSNLPTSKTSAAVRMQVPLAAKNLISLMEGKEPVEKYNGYAACPIITDYGHVLLCEFDYDKKQASSFPFSMLDVSQEQWAAWLLKVYILKPLYFYGMLNGRA